jgi:YHS domain-containing protein
MRFFKQAVIAGLIAVGASGHAVAGSPIYTGLFGNTAIHGYDTVAYFTENKPVKGSNNYTADWQGATFKFSSPANRDKFKAAPDKYAPQYGGYCAYAVAMNSSKVSTEPDAFKVVGGKLYLNYDQDIRKKWEANQAQFISEANAIWPKIRND